MYGALTAGPALNCRPHRSRQRIDLDLVARLDGATPASILSSLLGSHPRLTIDAARTPGSNEMSQASQGPQATLKKLRVIEEDARTYEQDVGTQVLQLGFPLLHIAPRAQSDGRGRSEKRVLAPIAFIPLTMRVRSGRNPGLDLACAESGVDRVVPNWALLAWLSQQIGRKLVPTFDDPDGSAPWEEIQALEQLVREALKIRGDAVVEPQMALRPTPKLEDTDGIGILACGVLGLFPLANQALLQDLEAMAAGEVELAGPVESFTRVDAAPGVALAIQPEPRPRVRNLARERLISQADPCQARAVELARSCRGLVVHGPPGTGKSQTITNIIGNHLAHGQRVLVVCDKRTALDVVHHRLRHSGLDNLCALIHDPQHDQRDLYKSIREQLDSLADMRTNPRADTELAALDREMLALYEPLSRHASALCDPPSAVGLSFHTLCGQWLALMSQLGEPGDPIAGVDFAELLPAEIHVREALERAIAEDLPSNLWHKNIGISVDAYFAQSRGEWRRRVDRLFAAAEVADATVAPTILPFAGSRAPREVGLARAAWADRFEDTFASTTKPLRERWTNADAPALAKARAELEQAAEHVQRAREPLDVELAAVQGTTPIPAQQAEHWLGALGGYLQIAHKWYRLLLFGRRRRARKVLARFGLALAAGAAQRATKFLEVLRARILVRSLHHEALALPPASDDTILREVEQSRAVMMALGALDGEAALVADAPSIRQALRSQVKLTALFDGLRRAVARGNAIAQVEAALADAPLFTEGFGADLAARLRRGEAIAATLRPLTEQLDSVEGLLRMERALAGLPTPLRTATLALAEQRTEPSTGWVAIQCGVLAAELGRRLREQPDLLAFDEDKLRTFYLRWRALETRRRALVRDVILHRWATRQRERLLAATGTRMSGVGADLRRRLTLQGKRAMRLRQVVALGAAMPDGDPLFDARPVWMASPETVAQLFPRSPIFDVVIFDEASQCRLEEALPVLLRARRVVIAGDPRQLPPTRFFESAVASGIEDEPTTDQELFEAQQSETEDLLSASLNLELDQCYLDVHYRSRHADLIEFSNKHFYASRLQSLPGHPSRRRATAPLRLVRADGAYVERRNSAEAQKVVEIVAELLSRPSPPSIGVACFNLTQRETILEALDEAGTRDPAFAQRLAAARVCRGEGSFEGLFVKNLENVQGDERDHIIISTTYGRDLEGRFYRRFGPLAMSGGGRRLNVLVTRARDQIHIVTSIPSEVYRADWPLHPGQQPNGGLLLFHYLRWAEDLATTYAERSGADLPHEGARPPLVMHDTAYRSTVVDALGHQLVASSRCIAEAYWGNDGFCVDLALRAADAPEATMIGVLCDSSRFDKATDRIEWDMFRSVVLEDQGWSLRRVCSPQLFRNLQGTLSGLTTTTPTQDQAVSQHD